jgi:hypothetical protein
MAYQTANTPLHRHYKPWLTMAFKNAGTIQLQVTVPSAWGKAHASSSPSTVLTRSHSSIHSLYLLKNSSSVPVEDKMMNLLLSCKA